jgi:hypothetical protein
MSEGAGTAGAGSTGAEAAGKGVEAGVFFGARFLATGLDGAIGSSLANTGFGLATATLSDMKSPGVVVTLTRTLAGWWPSSV